MNFFRFIRGLFRAAEPTPSSFNSDVSSTNVQADNDVTSKGTPELQSIDPIDLFIEENKENENLTVIYRMRGHFSPEKIRNIFILLHEKMKTPAIARNIGAILNELLPTSLITESNISWLCDEILILPRYLSDLNLFHALFGLKNNQLLDQEILDTFRTHHHREDFIWSMVILFRINLLQPANIDSIKNRQDLPAIRRMLQFFIWHRADRQHTTPYLSQEQFNSILIVNSPESYLLTEEAAHLIQRLPERVFTQGVWNQIYEYCSTYNHPRELLELFIMEFLPPEEHRLDIPSTPPRLNYSQSVHNEYVEQSVTLSTTKLFKRYRHKIHGDALDHILNEVALWLRELPNSDKNNIAKRCFSRILGLQVERAGVNLKQLLALAWIAIHDDCQRLSSLENAKQRLVDGFYEIQRGYNLSESGLDDQNTDSPICSGGTFNKILEKLNGIAPDVEINFLTTALASMKLPVVVREETIHYLSYVARFDFFSYHRLVNHINSLGLEIIWNSIKTKVTERMFNEFGCLYGNNKNHPQFLGLVDAGVYSSLNESPSFQKQISLSEGYRQYCSYILHCRFFSSRTPQEAVALFRTTNAGDVNLAVSGADENLVRDRRSGL